MVTRKLKRIIIAAVSENGIIGCKNKIPWHSSEELKHFKSTTLGSPILMGRKTYDSLKAPLNKRLNLIISSKPVKSNSMENMIYFQSVKEAYIYLRNNGFNKVYIGGGGKIYRNTIKHAEEMIISHMKFDVVGDTRFPKINLKIWKVKNETERTNFIIKHYVRS